jgi:hypothetical protein
MLILSSTAVHVLVFMYVKTVHGNPLRHKSTHENKNRNTYTQITQEQKPIRDTLFIFFGSINAFICLFTSLKLEWRWGSRHHIKSGCGSLYMPK